MPCFVPTTIDEWKNHKQERVRAALEPRFILQYYLGTSLTEATNMPLWQMRWYIARIQEEFKRAADANQPPNSKAAHHNDPGTRAITGKQRHHVPAKLRRAT